MSKMTIKQQIYIMHMFSTFYANVCQNLKIISIECQIVINKTQEETFSLFTYPTPCISNICPRLLPRSSTTEPMCSSGTSTVAICKETILWEFDCRRDNKMIFWLIRKWVLLLCIWNHPYNDFTFHSVPQPSIDKYKR